jgi:hypothetical protein
MEDEFEQIEITWRHRLEEVAADDLGSRCVSAFCDSRFGVFGDVRPIEHNASQCGVGILKPRQEHAVGPADVDSQPDVLRRVSLQIVEEVHAQRRPAST